MAGCCGLDAFLETRGDWWCRLREEVKEVNGSEVADKLVIGEEVIDKVVVLRGRDDDKFLCGRGLMSPSS